MSEKLNSYLEKKPEIVFEWSDKETNARGWLVINSLKGGAAGGGTRMRKGLTRSEVEDLAKTMEIKFNVCGPSIGGAKSGIDFDPLDPRKDEVLKRWFIAIRPLLQSYYGTAGDLNVDEKKEVSPILKQLGIQHAQEGVLEGHFHYPDDLKIKILERLKTGCALNVITEKYSPLPNSNSYSTIDLITGFGVAESIRLFYQLYKNESLKNKRIFIQGWGNVGAAAGWYLSQSGANIIVIQDKDGYVLSESGFSFKDVTDFINGKVNNTVTGANKNPGLLPVDMIPTLGIEVFVPAAASKINDAVFIEKLISSGLKTISCGANVPFAEEGIIYGAVSQQIDQKISLIPDFIANCGVARLFSYLMENKGPVEEAAIYNDITETMKKALSRTFEMSSDPLNIAHRALNNYVV